MGTVPIMVDLDIGAVSPRLLPPILTLKRCLQVDLAIIH